VAIYHSRLTESRYDEDRSQEALDFIEEVTEVCRRRGFAIGHEDGHGGFQVYRYVQPDKLEANLDWFEAAVEMRWLDDQYAPEPEPKQDPFTADAKDPFE
jgi:hypothetical protein